MTAIAASKRINLLVIINVFVRRQIQQQHKLSDAQAIVSRMTSRCTDRTNSS